MSRPAGTARELKLYRSARDDNWFAFGSVAGWVTFPAEIGGWQKRQPAPGVDLLDLRESPLRIGFNTGIPGAPGDYGGERYTTVGSARAPQA
jgi:hypothetical protein